MVKNQPCNVGDPGSIPGLGRSPRGEHDNPLHESCLEHPHGRGAWWAIQSMGMQRAGHDWVTKHSTAHSEVAIYTKTK